MAACAGIGGDVFDDWVNWVLRGHHGEKPENISSFKWRGLGYSVTLHCSLAKKQDPNWTKKLPQELWFRAAGTAAGYSEVDPDICFDSVISKTQPMDNVIPLEPLPDMPVAKKRGSLRNLMTMRPSNVKMMSLKSKRYLLTSVVTN